MPAAKRYLVTGGCGFIGGHLVAHLLAQGQSVRVLDDLSTGRRSDLPAEAELIVGDVADPGAVRQAMEGVDGCFHLAAVASVQRCTDAWFDSHRVNLSGTVVLMDAAREAHLPVVYASSAAVYGDCPERPLQESSRCRPLSAYGADKLGGELHAHAAATVHGLSSVGLRFFNVFGPGQDPASPYSGVISIFAQRLLEGAPLTIFGDGRQTRDFVYVGDVVNALQAAMARTATLSRTAEVFNVCTGRAVSVRDLVAMLGVVAERTPQIVHAPRRSGDIASSIGDPARIGLHLGWRARVSVEAGLRATLQHLASNDARPGGAAPQREPAGKALSTFDPLLSGKSVHVRNHRSHRRDPCGPSPFGRAAAPGIPRL